MVIVDDGLSVSEKICKNFSMHIADLIDEKRCFFIPHTLISLKLINIGLFDKFKTDFKNFNVVYGSNAKGKTTLVRSIGHVFDLHRCPKEMLLKKGSSSGSIDVDFIKKSNICLELSEEVLDYEEEDSDCVPVYEHKIEDLPYVPWPIKSIILDDAGAELTKQQYTRFLEYLQELNGELQVILTVTSSDDRPRDMFLRMFPGCNFIDLDSIKLQERLF